MSLAGGPGFNVYVSAAPDAPKALVLFQEGFGVNDHIRNVADRFADEGYFVVAPHLYHRDGSPEVDYDNVDEAVKFMSSITREGLTNDLDATIAYLTSLGYDRASIGCVGFCMGGSVSFYTATRGVVGAAVSFYGGGLSSSRMGLPPLIELAAELSSPWLGFYGSEDHGIALSDVEALRDALEPTSVETEIVIYEGAQHGFHCDARENVYDETAAQDAYESTLEFFARNLSLKS